jgi:DNA helicase-4
LLTYDDNEKKTNDFTGALHQMGATVVKAIDRILQDSPNSRNILVIGRFHFDGRNLAKSPDLFGYDESKGKIVCKKHPEVAIDFLTAHGSKGLGYDNVVIINARDALFGFPCQIEEEPLLQYVIKDEENFSYSEERRLFYVALTRTKNRVYIVTPQYHPSRFILELKDHHKSIPLEGKDLEPREIEVSKHLCPYCHYPLQRRANNALNRVIWVCSNDPEVCGYMTNLVESGKMQICKCPQMPYWLSHC